MYTSWQCMRVINFGSLLGHLVPLNPSSSIGFSTLLIILTLIVIPFCIIRHKYTTDIENIIMKQGYDIKISLRDNKHERDTKISQQSVCALSYDNISFQPEGASKSCNRLRHNYRYIISFNLSNILSCFKFLFVYSTEW